MKNVKKTACFEDESDSDIEHKKVEREVTKFVKFNADKIDESIENLASPDHASKIKQDNNARAGTPKE